MYSHFTSSETIWWFLEIGVPQIIHFNGMFHSQLSIRGYPIKMEIPISIVHTLEELRHHHRGWLTPAIMGCSTCSTTYLADHPT